MKKNIIAISLLECLLSIAIIASIAMMAVRYYMVTTRDMRVSHAISQIKRITDASYAWLQAQKQANFSAEGGGQTISIAELVDDQLLKNKNDTIAPWGGTIAVAPGDDDPAYVKITLNNIPQSACRNLTRQLDYINREKMVGTCGSKTGNTFVGEF